MSKYTTEVRFLCEEACGLDESVGYKRIDAVVTEASPKIFDFPFPIFDENYRLTLEKKILKHYYTREISEESTGLWKLRLDAKMNEIMPYYNKLYESELIEFNPMYTANLTRDKNTDFDSTRRGTENITDTTSSTYSNSKTSENDGTVDATTATSGIDTVTKLFSDTPQGDLTGITDMKYLTTAEKSTSDIDDTTTQESTSHNEGTESDSGTASVNYGRTRGDSDTLNTTEDYLEHVVGYEGVTGSKMLKEYRDTFLNIDMMVINELEPLFFQLW